MTGEMCAEEVTPEAFPVHFAIATMIRGTVEPFDQYQGPYIQTRDRGRVWLTSTDGVIARWWSEALNTQSWEFWAEDIEEARRAWRGPWREVPR